MKQSIMVRRVGQHDNFEWLHSLMNQTVKRFNLDPKFLGIAMTPSELRNSYLAAETTKDGFVAEKEGSVIAIMGVSLSEVTSNGYVEFGVVEGHEAILHELVEKCSSIVQQRGGKKLFKFVFSQFGQIRNKEIALWEQLGFDSDQFTNVTLLLDLKGWSVPEDFHGERIYPATDLALSEISQILMDDGEEQIVELIRKQFVEKSADQIILTLVDEGTKQPAGLAFYRIIKANEGSDNEFLDASGFSVHFRPGYSLKKEEKQRLLHAALLSMKQLDIFHVYSRITLKHFDVFSMLVREGFEDPGFEQNCTISLFKMV